MLRVECTFWIECSRLQNCSVALSGCSFDVSPAKLMFGLEKKHFNIVLPVLCMFHCCTSFVYLFVIE